MSASKKSISIYDMLIDTSDDLNQLKEFNDLLKDFKPSGAVKSEEATSVESNPNTTPKQRRTLTSTSTSQKLDETYVNTNIKKVLENCLLRSSANNNESLTNKKSDLSLKILENLIVNRANFEHFDKIIMTIATMLDKQYFDKLIRLFETTNPEHGLKVIKVFVELMGKQLHQNLAIVNPLLRIMESGFKHVNNDIKAQCYYCWGSLIDNFALDKEFFFKPKKMSLLLMPLVNKCKTYKDERVCKAKVLAWVKLIENIGEKLQNYDMKILMPFFKYCYGAKNFPELFDDTEEAIKEFQAKFEKFLTHKIETEHQFSSLTQIGHELLLSIILDSSKSKLSGDLKKKFAYVDLSKNFDMRSSLNGSISWLSIFKCYFELYLTSKPQSINDPILIIESWKQMCEWLNLNYNETDDVNSKKMMTRNEVSDDSAELMKYFLANTIEYINNFSLLSSKHAENKFIGQLVSRAVLVFLNEYNKSLSTNEEFQKNLTKMIGKAANFLLVPDEENTNSFLTNMRHLFDLLESNDNLIDLIEWLHIANKFYDQLRSLKTKTTQITITRKNYEVINRCILFPFRYYKILRIVDNDIKLIMNVCTNITKLFSALIKQYRIKLVENKTTQTPVTLNEIQNINNWLTTLFTTLKANQTEHHDMTSLHDLLDFWSQIMQHNKTCTSATISQVENTLKLMQLQSQFLQYTIQNLFEFDLFNSQLQQSNQQFLQQPNTTPKMEYDDDQNTTHDQIMPSQTLIEKFTNAKKQQPERNSLSQFSDLIDLLKSLIHLFYSFIQSQPSLSQSLSKISSLSEDEPSYNNKNFEFTDKSNTSDLVVENKNAVQIFVNLTEMLSVLFTRIKPHCILSEILLNFAQSIEFLTELYSISKSNVLPSISGTNGSSTPGTPAENPAHTASPGQSLKKQQIQIQQHLSHINSHFRYSKQSMISILQANRKSNDLFDTFSMQIASYIQNNLPKTYSKHEFDTNLLLKLEPVFYAFLNFQTKLSLKQKTLQAWNGTFGKSTVNSLNYTKRLEKLFVELREEMINNSNSNKSNPSNVTCGKYFGIGFIALSLPGFKPLDLLNQATNTTSNSVMFQQMMMDDEDGGCNEKENNPESMTISSFSNTANPIITQSGEKQTSAKLKQVKEFLNDSNSSVPIVHLVPSKANHASPQKSFTDDIKAMVSNSVTATVNFVFSPISAGRQSIFGSSGSASKTVKTPDSSTTTTNQTRQSARTPLSNSSKRKLNLNFQQIDQLPDTDFVEITSVSKSASLTDVLNRKNSKQENSKSSSSSSSRKSMGSASLFKQPLTEHQKETRRHKSFIPTVYMDSAFTEPDATMDSQMSTMDEDTNTQSMMMAPPLPSAVNQSVNLNTSGASVKTASFCDAKGDDVAPLKTGSENNKDIVESEKSTGILNSSKNNGSRIDTNDENACDKMDLDSSMNQEKKEESEDSLITDDESKEEFSKETNKAAPVVANIIPIVQQQKPPTTTTLNMPVNTIKFQSKINPKKQIELFEVSKSKVEPLVPKVTESKSETEVLHTSSEAVVAQNNEQESKAPEETQQQSKEAPTVENQKENSTESENENNEAESNLPRRRSLRIKTKPVVKSPEISETNTTTTDSQVQEAKNQISSSNELKNSISTLSEEIADKIEELAESEMLVVEAEKSEPEKSVKTYKKLDKAKLKSNLIKRSKRLLIKQKSTVTTTTNPSTTKISLVKLGTSTKNGTHTSGAITKNTANTINKKNFKNKLKSIVKNFASNTAKEEASASSSAQQTESEKEKTQQDRALRKKAKNAKRLELIQQLNTEFSQSIVNNVTSSEPIKVGTQLTVAAKEAKKVESEKAAVETRQNIVSTAAKELVVSDEDDEPLSKLVEKRKLNKGKQTDTTLNLSLSQPKATETVVVETTKSNEATEPIADVSKSNSANKVLDPVMEEELSRRVMSQTPPSTPPVTNTHLSRLRRESIMNSAPSIITGPKSVLTTDTLLHKLNNTPTTSILKKRLSKLLADTEKQQQQLQHHHHTSSSSGNTLAQSIIQISESTTTTPMGSIKRRVSFCESVQIEEIEPNNNGMNKSLLGRSIPRLQNKAKLVLSPYFSAKNSQSLNLVPNSPQTSANGSVNAPHNTSATNTPTSSKPESSMNSSVTSTPSLANTTPSATVSTPNLSQLSSASSSVSPVTTNKIPSNLSTFLQMKYNSANRLSESANCLLSPTNHSGMVGGGSLSMPASPQQQSQQPASLINFFSNNKQNFLSQRSTMIQMLQQKMSQNQSSSSNQPQNSQPQNNSISSTPTSNPSAPNNTPNNLSETPKKAANNPSESSEKTSEKLEESLSEANNTNSSSSKTMGSVEEEMDKLEATSNCLDTSIESEAALIEKQAAMQQQKCADESMSEETNNKSGMEVDSTVEAESISSKQTVVEEKVVFVENNVRPKVIDKVNENIKSFLDMEVIEQLGSLDVDSLNQLDDVIDEAKLQIISYLSKFQKAIRVSLVKAKENSDN